ncbi:MAG: hypothetical protein ACFFGZ_03565 [Candidatus Thorarchaeota archaeon]
MESLETEKTQSTKKRKGKMSRLSDPRKEYHFRVFRVDRGLFDRPEKEQAHWLCHALGLAGSSTREAEESMVSAILCEILAASRERRGLTNDDLSKRVSTNRSKKTGKKVKVPSRGTIAYHAARLEKTGIVVRRGRHWELREYTLEHTLQRMKEDLNRFIEDLLHVAREIDRR